MREEGNSFRRTLVSWRWEGVGFASSELDAFSGVREMDQASPLRKRTLDAAATELIVEDGANSTELLAVRAEMRFPDSRSNGRFVSSHWVSQA